MCTIVLSNHSKITYDYNHSVTADGAEIKLSLTNAVPCFKQQRKTTFSLAQKKNPTINRHGYCVLTFLTLNVIENSLAAWTRRHSHINIIITTDIK